MTAAHPPVHVPADASRRPAGRGLFTSLLKSIPMWVAAVLAVVASPIAFFFILMLCAVLLAVGVVLWVRTRHVLTLAIGVGLLLGSIPYFIAILNTVYWS